MSKNKIEYNKTGFQWNAQHEDTDEKNELRDLSVLVDEVNGVDHLNRTLTPIAQNREEQRAKMKEVLDSIPLEINQKSKDVNGEKKAIIESAIASLDVSFIKNKETDFDIKNESVVKEDVKPLKKKVKSSTESTAKTQFKDNLKMICGPTVAFAVICTVIFIGIQGSKKLDNQNKQLKIDPKVSAPIESMNQKGAAPITNVNMVVSQDSSKKKALVDKGLVSVNDNIKAQSVNPNDSISVGGVIQRGESSEVPNNQFVSIKEPEKIEPLSITKVVPINGGKVLPIISLAQWPNAINLKELGDNFVKVESLFPQNIYKKQATFNGQDILTIYDKRTVAQEKFVKNSQVCYFMPNEIGRSWLDVNYFVMSYCFINNQFIGINMYTNAEPDVMRKIESGIKKYPYYQISSVYKGDGYNLISIEQNQAYKILEAFRMEMLNKMMN
jgi:hypothetical protein